MSKSTPGPWTVDLSSAYHSGHEEDGRLLVRDSTGFAVVQSNQRNGGSSEETFANGRLISSAPELLKAAKQALSLIPQLNGNRDTFFVEDLRKAIAKAEGTSE